MQPTVAPRSLSTAILSAWHSLPLCHLLSKHLQEFAFKCPSCLPFSPWNILPPDFACTLLVFLCLPPRCVLLRMETRRFTPSVCWVWSTPYTVGSCTACVDAEAMDKNVPGGDGELPTHCLLSLLCARHRPGGKAQR